MESIPNRHDQEPAHHRARANVACHRTPTDARAQRASPAGARRWQAGGDPFAAGSASHRDPPRRRPGGDHCRSGHDRRRVRDQPQCAARRGHCAAMAENKYGCAIIVDGKKVVGVFTTVDALTPSRPFCALVLGCLMRAGEPQPRGRHVQPCAWIARCAPRCGWALSCRSFPLAREPHRVAP